MKYRVILRHESGKHVVQHSENGLTWAPVLIGTPGDLYTAEFDSSPEAELFMLGFSQRVESESFFAGHFTVKSKIDTRETHQGSHGGLMRFIEPDTRSLDYIVHNRTNHNSDSNSTGDRNHSDSSVGVDRKP